MATRAHITSVEAIESFRASLILYKSKAKPALEEVSSEIVRTRVWLQSSQRIHWEGIVKRRARTLEEANAALFSSKLSSLREVSSSEQLAVTKAKRKLEEAEEKLRVIKRWDRNFDNQVEPLIRKLEKMHAILADDLTKAVVYLGQTIGILDAYAGIIAPGVATGSGQPSEPPKPATDDAIASEPAAPAVPKEDVS
ncbi:MAG: hypothetical protein JWQ04_2488 [Pedosphaera sp.]|nr:hypothetical protein [Pedosphaera sp.]